MTSPSAWSSTPPSPVIITTTPITTVESTTTLTSEYQSTHRSTSSQTITIASATVIESTVTLTITFHSTYLATLGNTITILPPPISWSLQYSTPASSSISPQTIVTFTEVAITIVEPDRTFVSTATIPSTTSYPTDIPPTQPSPYVVVVGPDNHDHGWNSWSSPQQGGLIAGVVIAFLLILACLIFWCNSRKKTWIAGDWSVNSRPGWGIHQPGQLVTQRHNGLGLRGGGKAGIWERVRLGISRGSQYHGQARDLA